MANPHLAPEEEKEEKKVAHVDGLKVTTDALATASTVVADPHVHDCTGPDLTCPCGFVFRTGRYMFSVDIYDNETKTSVINEGFNCDAVSPIVETLRELADTLEQRR